MIREALADAGPLSVVVVDIGNTRTSIARWVDGEIRDVARALSADAPAVRDTLTSVRSHCENQVRQAIVIASVVPPSTALLAAHIEDDLDLRPFIIGGNTPLPLEVAVAEPEKVGVDRLCAAAAAYDRIRQSCVIVDVGSAVTVDYVDADGIFQGGAILPGAALQARALAEGTAQLPLVELTEDFAVPGRDTRSAIAAGIGLGLAGAIRAIVEEFATQIGTWPQTVLTGGGAPVLKAHLSFIDNHVPDLCLMGIGLAYVKRALQMLGE